jgi:hypothetical protein
MIFFVFGLAVFTALVAAVFGGRVLTVAAHPRAYLSGFLMWCYIGIASAAAGISYWLWTVFAANR